MFCCSIKSGSKVFHNQNCYKVKLMNKQNIRYFHTIDEARNNGYKFCSCCSLLCKKLRSESKSLREYSQKHKISYFKNSDFLEIQTNYSTWKILITDSKKIQLYHKNIHINPQNSPVPGYHQQNVKSNTIMGYFRYIINHDAYRLKNPLVSYTTGHQIRKSTKRQRKKQKALKRREKRQKVWMVLNLIDNVSKMGKISVV